MELIAALLILLKVCISCRDCHANPDAKRLYDDLLRRGGYNKLVRPVHKYEDVLYVRLGLKLSQLIDVLNNDFIHHFQRKAKHVLLMITESVDSCDDEKNQVMTTNVWLTQEWTDENLKWTPSEYGEVDILYVPSEEIWLPDVVLFNNADGNYEVTLMTKASVRSNGRVLWEPPAVYKSSCTMDVEFFPFDEQLCSLKFGSWTYDATQVEIIHIRQPQSLESNFSRHSGENHSSEVNIKEGVVLIQRGIDLTDFYENVEWDLLAVPALKRIYSSEECSGCVDDDNDDDGNGGGDGASQDTKYGEVKNCSRCPEWCLKDWRHYRPEITFDITIRRKTLFHTVNLILPCVAISLLTVIVFHLPSDSGEKVALSISILLSLTVFFLLLAEIIPPTSLVVPLIGKFLLFTMLLVTFSIFVTVLVLNVHFRVPSPRLVEMGPRTRYVFLQLLPQIFRVDVGRCFGKKKPFLPYNLPVGLNHTVTHECISTPHLRAPLDTSIHSPINYQTLIGMDIFPKEQSEEPLIIRSKFSESRPCTARIITHHNNFVRRSQYWEGGIFGREEMRNALRDKLQQLVKERTYESKGQQVESSTRVQSSSRDDRTLVCSTRSYELSTTSMAFRRNLQQEKVKSSSPGKHPEVLKAFEGVHFIAEHLRRENEIKTVLEDWKFVANMLDRLFFWMFTLVCLCGGVIILLQAPSIYDSRLPLKKAKT